MGVGCARQGWRVVILSGSLRPLQLLRPCAVGWLPWAVYAPWQQPPPGRSLGVSGSLPVRHAHQPWATVGVVHGHHTRVNQDNEEGRGEHHPNRPQDCKAGEHAQEGAGVHPSRGNNSSTAPTRFPAKTSSPVSLRKSASRIPVRADNHFLESPVQGALGEVQLQRGATSHSTCEKLGAARRPAAGVACRARMNEAVHRAPHVVG